MENDLKILVVDDAVVYRQILSKIVSKFENAELIGTAPSGRIALSKIELKQPDLVLLDVFMPEMDGLETLGRIKKQYPHIDVIMLSGVDKETANLTMKALEAGALDFIPKPRGVSADANTAELRTALSRLILMARTRKYSRQARVISGAERGPKPAPAKPAPAKPAPAKPAPAKPAPLLPRKAAVKKKPAPPPRKPIPRQEEKIPVPETRPYRRADRIDVVAIGVSTGGPNALQEIVPQIENDFPVPIVVVQHMPPMFTDSLAARLDSASSIEVVEGKDGQILEKGVMYIAPGGRHMVVRKDGFNNKMIALLDSPPVNSCRPSVDVLFRSVGLVYEGNVLTVILTGMGNDGVSGVTAIRRKGGYSIVQDEKSSVIWGMPGAVVDANEANEIVPLDKIASRVMRIVRRGHF
ncbi:chemotaxis-specific protein-glutamate methyltransferase CheB [Desulfobacterales bacterium HSG2]|nr:chemotaxis-specific protein-glutamate methyltransferase CheB [Desulfobacterales bacterium HSG2]